MRGLTCAWNEGAINSFAAVTCQNADGDQKEKHILSFHFIGINPLKYHCANHSAGQLSFQHWMQKVS